MEAVLDEKLNPSKNSDNSDIIRLTKSNHSVGIPYKKMSIICQLKSVKKINKTNVFYKTINAK